MNVKVAISDQNKFPSSSVSGDRGYQVRITG